MEITIDGDKVITAHLHGHSIKTDQPVNLGGENSAPTPFDLFLASIGTCAGIYIKSFCDNRNVSSENIRIIQTAEFDPDSGLPVNIEINIKLPSDFPERYKDAVIKAASLCKVKKTIADPPVFKVITSLL